MNKREALGHRCWGLFTGLFICSLTWTNTWARIAVLIPFMYFFWFGADHFKGD